MTSTLEKRVKDLEASGDARGGGGCERCRGLLVTVSNVISGEFHSARWNGEEVSEEEAFERQTEVRCPRCGRNLDTGTGLVISVGGRCQAGGRYGA